jgi:hypothetical protein
VLHLDVASRAVNLVLDEDGTFRWRSEDCICVYTGCGTWTATAAGVTLTPPPGEPLAWELGAATRERGSWFVRSVELHGAGGAIDATVQLEDGGVLSQRWVAGQVCPSCIPAVPGALPSGKPPTACTRDIPRKCSPTGACH